MLSLVASAAGCIGGPNHESRERSEAAGGEVHGTQLAAVQHGNWHEAATGHGAANVPREALDGMERESAPGGHFRDQTREQEPAAARVVAPPASSSPPPVSSAPPSAAPTSPRRARPRGAH